MTQKTDSDQPCEVCLEATAVGRRRFSGRRALQRPDGTRTYVCGPCQEDLLSRPAGKQRAHDDERRRQAETWIVGAISAR